MTTPRLCQRCEEPASRFNARYCLACKILCARCGESPRATSGGGYCRPCNAEYAVEQRAAAREEMFERYGDRCGCCGESERIFLALDHINDDGAEHRRRMTGRSRNEGGGGAPSIALWLKSNGWPEGFQILCHNCNWAKSRGGCPHQRKEESP